MLRSSSFLTHYSLFRKVKPSSEGRKSRRRITMWSLTDSILEGYGGPEGSLRRSTGRNEKGSEQCRRILTDLLIINLFIIYIYIPGASGGIRRGVWQKKLKRVVCPEKWVLPMGGWCSLFVGCWHVLFALWCHWTHVVSENAQVQESLSGTFLTNHR